MILRDLIRGDLCIPFPSISSFDHRLRDTYMCYTFELYLTNCTPESIAKYIKHSLILGLQTEGIYC